MKNDQALNLRYQALISSFIIFHNAETYLIIANNQHNVCHYLGVSHSSESTGISFLTSQSPSSLIVGEDSDFTVEKKNIIGVLTFFLHSD